MWNPFKKSKEQQIEKNESNITKEFHKEDINTYAEMYQFTKSIFVYASSGEDEFTVIAPNEIISNPYIKFITHNILWHHINNNYYQVSSLVNKGKETEVTFTIIS